MQNGKRLKVIKGSHYTETYSDAIQVVYSVGRKTAELIFAEDVPSLPEEVIVTDDNIDSGDFNDQEYAGSRVIQARIKVPVEALNGIAKILMEASQAIQKEKEE